MESSLPTPEKTAGEDGDNVDQIETPEADDDDFDDDLEAEMMAEFEKGDWDSPENGGSGG